ncbi:hypothetical protein E2H14_24635 [Salmonella enterica subsp. enterica serovar Muenchen]|uniref:Uncharacterized protein n=2 Tax=Salmonella enteritidis TaxID=149539 RepID=A0A6X7PD60_SALEN|nr:hypothetical protein [Salmonella enterica]ECD5989908.1 hypothetical protein [Salmonella enterica subsp. enterica serovar Muenchen]HAB1256802.1 hypothetical protein [Salmonella enterica subsp. enterica serovar Enteritidis]EJV6193412.1 hypothetical protein [Salmonella enterica]HAB1518463.1 hypothetical protein [Salmonella enterica subsp. enterica serovar Enteritidis]
MNLMSKILASTVILCMPVAGFSGELVLEKNTKAEYKFTIFNNFDIVTQSLTGMGIDVVSTCKNKVKFEQCLGSIDVTNPDGTKTTYMLHCSTGMTNGGITVIAANAPVLNPGALVDWNMGIAGIFESTELGKSCEVYAKWYHTGLPPVVTRGNPTVEFTSSQGGGSVSLGTQNKIVLAPSQGVTTARLTYPTFLSANTDSYGGYRSRFLELSGDSNTVKLSASITSTAGWGHNARLIKSNGSDCSSMTTGESCDISFPPGAVASGQRLTGNIKIDVAIM